MSSHTTAKRSLVLALAASTLALTVTAAEKNRFAVPVKPVSAHQEKVNADTARAINKIPGVNIEAKDLTPPAQDPPIKGFHPIKRALQPVVQLEKTVSTCSSRLCDWKVQSAPCSRP